MAVLLLCFSGCSVVKPLAVDDPFRKLYEAAPASDSSLLSVTSTREDSRLTLSCHRMPLSLLCRILSDKFSVGMVYSETLADKLVTAEFKDTDLQSVLNVISRQVSVDVVRVGNTFFVGQLRPEDRGVLVRRVYGYDEAQLSKLLDTVKSLNGKSAVLENQILICADHESVLRRLAEVLDFVGEVDRGSWILQFYFVMLRKDALLDAGFDVKSSGTISYNVSENSVDFKNFSIDGFLNAGMSSAYADLYASPMLIIKDGQRGTWRDGERVPIPRKTVSPEGTVSVVGYDYTDTGLNVLCSISETRRGGLLSLEISISEIKSFVQEAPLTSQSVLTMSADMAPDKVYLLGEMQRYKTYDSQKNTLAFGRDEGKTVMQVWAKLYKISGNAISAPPKAKGVVDPPAK